MKSRLLQFVDRLRTAGLPISPAETLDASRALAVFGVEPLEFREAIAAAVVKDEADRVTFDDEFDRFFVVPSADTGKRKRPQPTGSGDRAGAVPQQSGFAKNPKDKPSERTSDRPRERAQEDPRQRPSEGQRLAHVRSLLDVPLKELTPEQIDDCDLLLRQLAEQLQGRQQRRQRFAQRGRLDLRRTLRRSISSGGVPMLPQFRHRRPGKPDLVALCDLSHSVAVASRFLLSLLSSAPSLFRRVRLFGYVDSPVEIWLQEGHLVHASPVDLYARSDFGMVLTRFQETEGSLLTRSTLLLILGDARNNRRPPRADVVARMLPAVQRIVWLNPEPRERWNTGDSVLAAYAPYCSDLLSAATLRQLYAALKGLTR